MATGSELQQHIANDMLAVEMPHLSVRVYQGDITKQHTDVIVSSCGQAIGSRTNPQGQTSAAMNKAGGPKYVAECNKIGTIHNNLAITGGGNMRCQKVFHLVMTGDTARWSDLISRTLREAETMGMTSLTFPAFGTGRLGVAAKTSAGAMFDAICKHDNHAKPSVLKNVCIVIFDAQMVKRFIEVFRNKAQVAKFPVQNIPMHPKPMPMTPEAMGSDGAKADVWDRLRGALEKISVSTGETTGSVRRTSPGKEAPFRPDTVELTDPMAQAALAFLTAEHLKELSNLNVKVVTEQTPDGKVLRVLGDPLETTTTIDKIYGILHKGHDAALSGGQIYIKMPSDWEDIASGEPWSSVPLKPATPEYQTVEQKFKSHDLSAATVAQIWRVQNPVLYEKFQFNKMIMERHNTDIKDNESVLYHGTTPDALENISSRGFNRSYCGQNATQYGRGVYFAVSAHYSANPKYSMPDDNGYQYMYQCRVLTGRYTKGRHSDKEAPVVGDVTYDSAVDDVTNPRIFVVYMDNHAYPEYLIAFKV